MGKPTAEYSNGSTEILQKLINPGSLLATFIPVALSACVSVHGSADWTAEACKLGESCEATGLLKMSSDGHGFIGILSFSDGSCLNISLPDDESRALLSRAPQQRTVRGVFKEFVFDSSEIFEINGRRVGIGSCGKDYIFVE